VEICLVEYLAAAEQVAFDGERSINRTSTSAPSCEVAYPAWGTTAPRSFNRCTASMRLLVVGARSHAARMLAVRLSASLASSRRWETAAQSGVVGASSRRLSATNTRDTRDQVRAWPASSPAR